MIAKSRFYCAGGVLTVVSLLFSGATASEQQADLQPLVAAANSKNETTSLNAIHELGNHGAEAVAPLVELLKSDSAVTRAYAAKALAMIGPPAKGAAQALVELLADPSPAVRREAVEAMGAIRPGPKVTVPLFAKLMQDADPGVRLRVMETIANAKGAAVPALVEALHNEAAAYWACVIIRDIGPDAAGTAPTLVEKLKDSNPEIRREATLALAAINATDTVADIVPLLKDDGANIAATYALAMLGSMPADAESIVRANTKSDDPVLKAVSMWALARIHPNDTSLKKAVIEQLVELLKSPDEYARLAAARGLASLPPSPEIAQPIFEKAMAGADEMTANYMLDALATIGPPAVPSLIKALAHPTLRGPVASILGRMGPPAAPATEALTKLLKDPSQNVRSEAAHALAGIGPGAKAAVPDLIQSLKDEEPGPRYAAVLALGRIGPAASAADLPLLDIMKKTDDSLSLLSAWALLNIHGASEKTANILMPELIVGLSLPMPQARQNAAEALGQLGPHAKGAVQALEKAAQDKEPGVRDAASKALEKIHGKASS